MGRYPDSRVMYLHGMEGSPKGTKGGWVQGHFACTCAPDLDAHGHKPHVFEEAVETARKAVEGFGPQLVIGSSFGGAVTLELMHRGVWSGGGTSFILLAPAGVFYGENATIPPGHRAIIIHAPSDKVVPYAHSLALMGTSIDPTGEASVELWNAKTDYRRDPRDHDGNHRLHDVIDPGGLLGRACEVLLAELGGSP